MGQDSNDLFTQAAASRLATRAPLADRMRPTTLDEVVGQAHLVGPGKPLRALVEADRLSSALLWGPPGVGKTTLARVVAEASSRRFVSLSAVNATVGDVRTVIAEAEHRLGAYDEGTILVLDEVHRFNKAQQDALLPAVETGILTLIGATTENPFFTVNAPLRSRSTLFRLQPLSDDDLETLVRRGLAEEQAEADPEVIAHLSHRAVGDGRQVLTTLEAAVALAVARVAVGGSGPAGDGPPYRITLADAEGATDLKALRYGRDEHYDVISAFIKSIRGSAPDAAIHWLARMLTAGEDPRFIARRLVIAASEDIGMADPTSLLVAEAASRAVDTVGLPEARLNLAHATIHLATAPKSNSAYRALAAALADLERRPVGEVPPHLRDAHYAGAREIGHGDGYRYPHDHPGAQVAQQYLPDELVGTRYYEPTDRGYEAGISPGGAPADDPGATESVTDNMV
ncbi:MAG: replication-associated recombination protein A [Acidimicrobiales bacterium]